MGGMESTPQAKSCRHMWQPFADTAHIWQKCVKCGEEQHGPTHTDVLMENLAYIFRDG